MEMASYLAGERWSDHPRCTHPLLAGLARMVNDHTSDGGRDRLIELIPSVIGRTSTDLRTDARIAWRCALGALPVIAAERQRSMAVAVIVADGVLAQLDGDGRRELLPASEDALQQVPEAARWAGQFTADHRGAPPQRFCRMAAPIIVRNAVIGIADACVSEPDRRLRDLLIAGIGELSDESGPIGPDLTDDSLVTGAGRAPGRADALA